MPANILPQQPPPPPSKELPKQKKKPKVSWMIVLFIIILTAVLIILGERFMMDLNQWFNPAYSQYGGYGYSDYDYHRASMVTKSYDQGDYEMYRLLIHTAFVVPVLLAAFLLYFWLHYRKEKHPKRIIAYPYFIFSIWLTLHLVIEAFYFLIKQYEELGLYIVLIILVALLTWLILFVQKKWDQKHQNNI